MNWKSRLSSWAQRKGKSRSYKGEKKSTQRKRAKSQTPKSKSTKDSSPSLAPRKRRKSQETKKQGKQSPSQISLEIERKLREDFHAEGQVNKILILGAGGVGKSTLFKQMLSLYGQEFTLQYRKQCISTIHTNCLRNIQALSELSTLYDDPVLNENREAQTIVGDLSLTKKEKLTPWTSALISQLWSDPGIQSAYLRDRHCGTAKTIGPGKPSSFNESLISELLVQFPQVIAQIIFSYSKAPIIGESCEYFMKNISRIGETDYLPTNQDIIQCRQRTSGIVEQEFTIDHNKFRLFDVGGQRNERKKWIHCFDHVVTVIIVVGLSGYNKTLHEDIGTNRLDEDLNLFENITNSRWFRDTPIVLFLNKSDIFKDQIRTSPLAQWFPDYTGGPTYDENIAWIEQQFLKRNYFKKPIYAHVTCAVDPLILKIIFNAVKDTVVRTALEKAGLV